MGNETDEYLKSLESELAPLKAGAQPVAGQETGQPDATESGETSWLGDVAMGVPRGFVAALDNTIDLGEWAVGTDAINLRSSTGLGRSKTKTGAAVEGISDFLTGFVPVVGWLGKAKWAAKGVKGAKGAKGALTLKQTEAALKAAGKTRKAYLMEAGRYAVAGAAADFMVFPAHEARLSNLINNLAEDYPSLSNPLTDYLAADPLDSELEGRFKNAIEGVGLGLIFDAIVLTKRGITAARKAEKAGKSPEAVTKAIHKAVPEKELNKVMDDLEKSTDFPEEAPSPKAAEEPAIPTKTEKELFPYRETKPKKKQKPLTAEDAARSRKVSEALENTGEIKNAEDLYSWQQKLMKTSKEVKEIEDLHLPDAVADENAAEVIKVTSEMAGERTPDVMMNRLTKEAKSMSGLSERMRAHRAFLYASAENLYKKAQGAAKDGATAADRISFMVAEKQHNQVQTLIRSLMRESGLTLRSWRKKSDYKLGLDLQNLPAKSGEDLQQMLDQGSLTTDSIRANAEKILALASGPGGVKNLASGELGKATARNSVWNKPNEVWINGLLGLKTFFVTVIGNGLASAYKPLEVALGRGMPFVGDVGAATAVKDMLKTYKYMLQMAFDTHKLARTGLAMPSVGRAGGKAFMKAEGQIGQTLGEQYVREKHIKGANFRMTAHNETASAAVDYLGEAIRLPMRFLISSDEFFKQLNARSHGLVKLEDMASTMLKEGKFKTRAIADEWVGEQFNNLIDSSGRLYSKDTFAHRAAQEAEEKGLTGLEAAEYVSKRMDGYDPGLGEVSAFSKDIAEELTFSASPIGPGGKWGQKTLLENPVLRQMVPFYTSPLNLIGFFWRRVDVLTPALGNKFESLKGLNLKYWEDMKSKDPFVRAQAKGRMGMGAGLMGLAIYAANTGRITGGGPSNSAERKIWEAAGNQPYSIRAGNKWVAYQRVDPFASFLGIAADIAYRIRNPEGIDEGYMESLMQGGIAALTHNITKKSYLKSIDEFLTFVEDPDMTSFKYLKGRAASWIPAMVGQMPGARPFSDDKYMREARDWTDYMLKRIPGESEKLDKQRNILGEPVARKLFLPVWDYVSPIFISTIKKDYVMKELSELRQGWDVPNPKLAGGLIDMTNYRNAKGQSAYDRYREILATVVVDGKTLRNSLDRLMRSGDYKALPKFGGTTQIDSPRIGLINRIMRKFKNAALKQAASEFPVFGEDYSNVHSFKDLMKSGVEWETRGAGGDPMDAQQLLETMNVAPR